MAGSKLFQRGLFQNNLYQQDTDDIAGSAIVIHRAGDELRYGPHFKRKHYEEIRDAALAAIAAEKAARELAAEKTAKAQADAEAARVAALHATWAQQDADFAEAQRRQMVIDALAAQSGAQRLGAAQQHAMMALHAARAATQRVAHDDDEEALALLLS